MDRRTKVALLTEALTIEDRSFLAYQMRVGCPFHPENHPEAHELFQELEEEEKAIIGELADLLTDEDESPTLGAYSMETGYYNYLELDRLLAVALDHMRSDLDRFTSLVERARQAEGRHLLRTLREMEETKRSQVERVEAFLASLETADEEAEEPEAATAASEG